MERISQHSSTVWTFSQGDERQLPSPHSMKLVNTLCFACMGTGDAGCECALPCFVGNTNICSAAPLTTPTSTRPLRRRVRCVASNRADRLPLTMPLCAHISLAITRRTQVARQAPAQSERMSRKKEQNPFSFNAFAGAEEPAPFT